MNTPKFSGEVMYTGTGNAKFQDITKIELEQLIDAENPDRSKETVVKITSISFGEGFIVRGIDNAQDIIGELKNQI